MSDSIAPDSASVEPRGKRLLAFALITLAGAVAALGSRALAPVQEVMQNDLGLSDNQVSLIQGAALAVPVVIGGLPLGLAVDRASRARLILLFALLGLVGSIATATALTFAWLFVARMLVGFATAAMIICTFSLLADLVPPAQRGRAKAIMVMGQYGASSAAFAAGGYLLHILPGGSWRQAAFWLTVPAFGIATAALFLLREPERRGVIRHNATALGALRHLWGARGVVAPLMVGIVLMEVPLFAIGTWAVPMWSRSFHLAPAEVGVIMTSTMLIGAIAGPLLGGVIADLCQRYSGPKLTVLAIAAVAFVSTPFALFPLTASVSTASILLTAFVTLAGANVATGVTLFTIILPNELRGLCLAILAGANSIFAFALAPLAVSALAGLIGGPSTIGVALAIVCTAGCLLCSITFVTARRHMPAQAVG